MKVAIICRGIPDSLNLMHGIFEMDQAAALSAAGVEVKVLAVDLRSVRRWRHWGYSHIERNGVDCHIMSIPVGKAPHSVICSIGASALKRLYKRAYKNGEKPDVLHAHFTRQGKMAAKLAKKEKLPLVITEHSSEMNKEQISASLLKTAKEAYSAADILIAVGAPLKKSIFEKTGKESVVVPNIVDTGLFKPNTEKQKNKELFTFVSVGGLIPRKRMDMLISAFSAVHAKHPQTELVIFGRGAEEERLRSQIESLRLNDSVHLKGLVSREEIAAQFQNSDAFVLLSQRETFGVAYIEALAAGLPVVATKCSGPEDFMKEDFGFLIDVNNEEQAVRAMTEVLERIDDFSSESISAQIKAQFSGESVSRQLIELYRQVAE